MSNVLHLEGLLFFVRPPPVLPVCPVGALRHYWVNTDTLLAAPCVLSCKIPGNRLGSPKYGERDLYAVSVYLHIVQATCRALCEMPLELEADGRQSLAAKFDCLWVSGTAEPVGKWFEWKDILAGHGW